MYKQTVVNTAGKCHHPRWVEELFYAFATRHLKSLRVEFLQLKTQNKDFGMSKIIGFVVTPHHDLTSHSRLFTGKLYRIKTKHARLVGNDAANAKLVKKQSIMRKVNRLSIYSMFTLYDLSEFAFQQTWFMPPIQLLYSIILCPNVCHCYWRSIPVVRLQIFHVRAEKIAIDGNSSITSLACTWQIAIAFWLTSSATYLKCSNYSPKCDLRSLFWRGDEFNYFLVFHHCVRPKWDTYVHRVYSVQYNTIWWVSATFDLNLADVIDRM